MMVFVGKREGALAAAQKLGVDVVLVVERAPRHTQPVVRGVIECDFTSEDWTAVARHVRTLGEPGAVLALTEAAVMPAARVRSQLAVPGLQPEHALLCTDKRAMKRAAEAAGLRCARFVEAAEGLRAAEVVERLGLPLVLKPARGSGGRGARRIDALADMPSMLPDAHVAAGFVDGVEMSVESLVQDGAPSSSTSPSTSSRAGRISCLPCFPTRSARRCSTSTSASSARSASSAE
jgi:carbamoylphosphate synthase large subunit